MKKQRLKIRILSISLFALLTLILTQSITYSQSTLPEPNRKALIQTRNALLDKSQSQRTWAWITMGVAIPVTGVGLIRGIFNGSGVLVAGLAMITGSIILFTLANKNQTKALKMDLGMIRISDLPLSGLSYDKQNLSRYFPNTSKSIPAIRISYAF